MRRARTGRAEHSGRLPARHGCGQRPRREPLTVTGGPLSESDAPAARPARAPGRSLPARPYLLAVWKQECRPTRKGLLDACSNTCFSVCTQSMSCNRGHLEVTGAPWWGVYASTGGDDPAGTPTQPSPPPWPSLTVTVTIVTTTMAARERQASSPPKTPGIRGWGPTGLSPAPPLPQGCPPVRAGTRGAALPPPCLPGDPGRDSFHPSCAHRAPPAPQPQPRPCEGCWVIPLSACPAGWPPTALPTRPAICSAGAAGPPDAQADDPAGGRDACSPPRFPHRRRRLAPARLRPSSRDVGGRTSPWGPPPSHCCGGPSASRPGPRLLATGHCCPSHAWHPLTNSGTAPVARDHLSERPPPHPAPSGRREDSETHRSTNAPGRLPLQGLQTGPHTPHSPSSWLPCREGVCTRRQGRGPGPGHWHPHHTRAPAGGAPLCPRAAAATPSGTTAPWAPPFPLPGGGTARGCGRERPQHTDPGGARPGAQHHQSLWLWQCSQGRREEPPHSRQGGASAHPENSRHCTGRLGSGTQARGWRGRRGHGCRRRKVVWWLLGELEGELPDDPAIPLLPEDPMGLTTGTQTDTCTRVSTAALLPANGLTEVPAPGCPREGAP